MKTSKSVRILDIIEESSGMRLSDIQAVLYGMTNPVVPFSRYNRGWWCTQLLGGPFYHAGLLHFFCKKGEDGLWRRNAIPHNGKPWKTMRLASHCPHGFFHPYHRCTCKK